MLPEKGKRALLGVTVCPILCEIPENFLQIFGSVNQRSITVRLLCSNRFGCLLSNVFAFFLKKVGAKKIIYKSEAGLPEGIISNQKFQFG
jgi:hypothetical protein